MRVIRLVRIPLSIERRGVVVARLVAWWRVSVGVLVVWSFAFLALLAPAQFRHHTSPTHQVILDVNIVTAVVAAPTMPSSTSGR